MRKGGSKNIGIGGARGLPGPNDHVMLDTGISRSLPAPQSKAPKPQETQTAGPAPAHHPERMGIRGAGANLVGDTALPTTVRRLPGIRGR